MSEQVTVGGHRLTRGPDAWTSTIDIGGPGTPMAVTTVDFSIVHVDDCGQSILEQPTAAQLAAVEFFVEHQSQLVCQMLKAIRCFLQRLASENWFMDDEFEVPTTDDELLEVMTLYSVTVNIDATDGIAWIGVGGGCDWDEEHGLGISLWRDLVLDVGRADVAFSAPDGGWNVREHLSEADQQRRDSVLAELLRDREQFEQQSWEQHQASLPDSVKLAQAIAMRDTDAAKQLLEAGVNLNDMPPPYGPAIFMAMEYQDPQIVREFLAAGARVDVCNELGQTPLEYAEQVMRLQQMANQTRAGMPGALESMMSEMGMDEELSLLSDDDLDDIEDQGVRDLLRSASDSLKGVYEKLAGGTAAMSEGAAPEQVAYYENVEREANEMLDHWSQIVAILRSAT